MTKEQQIQIVKEVIKTVDLWEKNHFKDYRHPNIFKYIVNDYYSKNADESLNIEEDHKTALEDIYKRLSGKNMNEIPSIDKILAVMKWLSDELEEHKFETINKFWENNTTGDKAFIDIVYERDIEIFKSFFSIKDRVKKARLFEDGRFVYDLIDESGEESTVNNFGDYDKNPFFEEKIKPGKHYYFPSSYEKGGYNLNRFKTFWEIFFPDNFQ